MKPVALAALFFAPLLSAQPCQNPWKEVSLHASHVDLEEFAYDIPLWDTNNAYKIARFKITDNDPLVFKIEGQFPQGRYLAFSIYDQNSADVVHPLASISDQDIIPDVGSVNPFQPEYSGETPHHVRYTIWAVPPSLLKAYQEKYPNVIVLRSDDTSTQFIEIVQRIYAPYERSFVTHPVLTAYRGRETQTAIPCPRNETSNQGKDLDQARANRPPAPRASVMQFFTPKRPANIVANPDTRYLSAQFSPFKRGMAVVRMLAPSPVPRHAISGYPDLSSAAEFDARFFSLCMTGGIQMLTFTCLDDRDLKQDADGYINLVVAERDPRTNGQYADWNFMPWPNVQFKVLLYRHLLPELEFAGSIARVRGLPGVDEGRGDLSEAEINTYAAQWFMGNYAPLGLHCSSNCQLDELVAGLLAKRREMGLD